MIYDIGEATERLENEQSRFTYLTAPSPTFPLLHLSHSSCSNPSFASPTSQTLHLRHLASRPCCLVQWLAHLTAFLEDNKFSGSIHSGTGCTDPREDNWVLFDMRSSEIRLKTEVKVEG